MDISLPTSSKACSTTWSCHLKWVDYSRIISRMQWRWVSTCCSKRSNITDTFVHQKPDIDTFVTVLTSTFWPMNLSSSPKCILPPEALQACKAFEQFYFSRHSGRRLTWQPQMVILITLKRPWWKKTEYEQCIGHCRHTSTISKEQTHSQCFNICYGCSCSL